METWKDIEGYEGLYQVSDAGRVRSLDRITTGKRDRRISGKILHQWENTFGYYMISLCKDGTPKTERVHRLVAKAFLVPITGKEVINHKDGNPKNNSVENLEWCTQAENIQHAYDTGLHKHHGGLSKEQVRYIRNSYKPYKHSAQKIADELGVNISTVYNVLHNRQEYLKEQNYL